MLKTAAAAASGLLLLCLLAQGNAFFLPSASPAYSRRATASSVLRTEGSKAKEALSWQESLELLISPTTTLAQRQVLFQVRVAGGVVDRRRDGRRGRAAAPLRGPPKPVCPLFFFFQGILIFCSTS